MKRIDWPVAVMVSVLALVVGGLQFAGKLPPEWLAAIAGGGVLVAGALRSYVKGDKP